MTHSDSAVLIRIGDFDQHSKICLTHPEFVVGRSKFSSYIICNLFVSKTQCIFDKKDTVWTICDKSSFGTFINRNQLEKDKPIELRDGDVIQFGPNSDFKFIFYSENIPKPPLKRLKADNSEVDIDVKQGEKNDLILECEEDKKQEDDRTQDAEKEAAEEKLLQEKQLLEEKLKEMQDLLEEKKKAEELLNKKLEEKEQQRLRDLKELQEQKDAQTKLMLDELRKEVADKEEVVRIQLAREIQILQAEKQKIETDIKAELSSKEESADNLKRLEDELDKVKKDLFNTEGKKQYLEKELEEFTKAKEDASESCLRAKQDILQNFGDLMETELQCSICNELFVTAMTLNCTHTFCQFCILEWKKKKRECPVCRSPITSENRSIVLDNFIDRMVENLSEELKHRRQEIVEERQVQDLLGYQSKPEPSNAPQRRRGRRHQSALSSQSSGDQSRVESDVIILSSEGSSEEEESDSNGTFGSFGSDELSDEDYVEGDPDAYYGGYGHCYRCGLYCICS